MDHKAILLISSPGHLLLFSARINYIQKSVLLIQVHARQKPDFMFDISLDDCSEIDPRVYEGHSDRNSRSMLGRSEQSKRLSSPSHYNG